MTSEASNTKTGVKSVGGAGKRVAIGLVLACLLGALMLYLGRDSLLRRACGTGSVPLAKLALTLGADAKARGTDGSGWIHILVTQPNPDPLIRLLTARGADINAANNLGQTPLHIAAEKAPPELVKAFLAAGARVNDKDGTSATPLHLAARSGRDDVVDLLLTAGANTDARTADDRTPLREARVNQHKTAAKVIEDAICANIRTNWCNIADFETQEAAFMACIPYLMDRDCWRSAAEYCGNYAIQFPSGKQRPKINEWHNDIQVKLAREK